MKLSGNQEFETARSTVWDHMFQADMLEECIPGAKTVEQVSENVYEGEVERTLASISIIMEITVEIESDKRPEEVSIEIEGTDNRTSSEARGNGTITMEENGQESTLSYDVNLNFTGRLASLGSRLIKRQMANDLETFFACSEEKISS